MSLFSELRRRNVIRVAVAYLASVWVVLQVAELVLDGFESPAWILRALLITAAVCFPLVVVLAWFYELTPEGVRGAESETIEPTQFLGRKIDFLIIGVLVLAVAFLIVDNYVPDGERRDRSIAVLPFEDLSGQDQEYFSHGISEELINLLTRVDGLRVIARTSAFAAAGRNSSVLEIANTLAVRYLLEGTVRTDGTTVRITAQLTDAETNSPIWSQSYDREMVGIFSIQTEVALAIIEKLPVTLAGPAPARGQPTSDTDAYEEFLRARNHLNNVELLAALAAVDKAIADDPEFAEAHQLRASIYWNSAGVVFDAAEAQQEMGRSARRALVYDPSLVLAQVMGVVGDLSNYTLAAELEAWERAARSEPNNVAALEPLVFNLRKTGYLNEALTYARQLLNADPYTTVAHARLQASLVACLREEEAIADIEGDTALVFGTASRDVENNHTNGGTVDDDHWVVAEIALLSNQYELAISQFTMELIEENIDDSWVRDLVEGARDPVTGVAYLDDRIPEIVADVRAGSASDSSEKALWLSGRLSRLYLLFGFLDRYYDIIWARGLSDSEWSNTDDLIDAGVVYADKGFTAHPRYVETAEALGITDVWDSRGAPDYCRRAADGWECSKLQRPCPAN